MTKKFTRTIEDFICEHCGNAVSGNGYTNHCPKCLWSKHVDVYPGDREEPCKGLMEPVATATRRGGKHTILHACLVCGFRKKNILLSDDNFESFADLSGKSLNNRSSSSKLKYARKQT